MLKRLLLIGFLFALPLLVLAQDDTETEEEVPVIPYFQADTGFNVPLLGDNWEHETTADSILYHDATTQENMLVNTVRILDDKEAIRLTLEEYLPATSADDLIYEGRIGLLNGTWTEQLYQTGDTSISAFSLVRSDRTFVITLWEDNESYDTRYLIARVPTQQDENGIVLAPDPMVGITMIQQALNGEDFATEPEDVQTITINNDEWIQATYPTDATPYNALGYQFRDYTYVTTVLGDIDEAILSNTDDFSRLILGFFITPDNSNYLYLGLAVSAAIFIVLILSMWLRFNNAHAELKLVEQIARDT